MSAYVRAHARVRVSVCVSVYEGIGGLICIKLFSTLSINFNSQYQCCGSILSLVQILFSLFQTHYH